MMINLAGEEVCALRHAISTGLSQYGTTSIHGKALQSIAQKIDKSARASKATEPINGEVIA